jgi:rhomboid protease GluP
VLLGLAMGRYGTGFGLLAAYLSGVGGNLLALWFYPEPHRSLGASGMVTGCLGLLAVQSIFLLRRHRKATRVFIAGVLGGLMLFVLLGLSPGTDVVAHLGGFATGLLAGGVLALLPNAILHSGKLSSVAAMTFGLLVLLSWWLALSSNTGG